MCALEDQESGSENDCKKNLRLRRLSRWGVLLTLLVIFAGTFYGRRLQREFDALVPLIPFAGFALLSGVLVLPLFFRPPRLYFSSGCFRGLLLPSVCTILVLLLLVCGISLIGAEGIERVHFIKYSSLCFLLYFSQRPKQLLRRAGAAYALAALIGTGEEFLQKLVPDRIFDTRDIAMNVSAAAFGLAFVWLHSLWNSACTGK